ncbi:MAG: DUF6268 family outer membrane beta-barrel protein [Bacteroidia bacterium]
MKSTLLKILLTFNLQLLTISCFSQFLDANILFKPRFSLEADYTIPQQNNSLDGYSTKASLLLPIKNNFDLGVSVKDLLKSTSIKDALKKVQPSMSQTFFRVDGGYSELYTSTQIFRINHVKAGITGIKLKYENLKIKTLLYSLNIGVYDQFQAYDFKGIYANAMIGRVKIINLNSLFFYGLYASYYDNQFLGTPVLAYHTQFAPKWSYTLILPSQTKLTYNITKGVRQDIVFGLQAQQFGDYDFQNYQRLSYRYNQLFASTQTRAKLSKNFHLYVEGGFRFNRTIREKEGYTTTSESIYSNGFYTKATLIINFNKALLNSGVFDLDI